MNNKSKFLNLLTVLITTLFALFNLTAQSNCDIECPDDFAVTANENNEYIVEDYFALGFASLEEFECDSEANVTQNPPPGTVVGLGEFEVELTVSFGGESDDCDFEIAVFEDNGDGGGDCDFDCPDDQFESVDGNGNYIIPNYATNGLLQITGDCGDFTSNQSPSPGTVVTEGIYQVSLNATSEDGNSSTGCSFSLEVDGTLAIESFSFDNFKVYPIPTKDRINLSSDMGHLYLYSLKGKLLHKSQNTSALDVSHLTNGIYILKLEKNNQLITKKIIVKR